jgi:hypothetical protein
MPQSGSAPLVSRVRVDVLKPDSRGFPRSGGTDIELGMTTEPQLELVTERRFLEAPDLVHPPEVQL